MQFPACHHASSIEFPLALLSSMLSSLLFSPPLACGCSSVEALNQTAGDVFLAPKLPHADAKVWRSQGAGLRHASEMLYAEKQKRPEEMEAWEIGQFCLEFFAGWEPRTQETAWAAESGRRGPSFPAKMPCHRPLGSDCARLVSICAEEKTEDWFRGSKSSMWLPAGLLEDQDKNFKSSVVKQEEATITRYEDAWEDREMGRLMGGGIDHTEEDWEDAWDAGVQMDLDTESLNSELFFSCSVVLGSRVRLLQVEPTGEVGFPPLPPPLPIPRICLPSMHSSSFAPLPLSRFLLPLTPFDDRPLLLEMLLLRPPCVSPRSSLRRFESWLRIVHVRVSGWTRTHLSSSASCRRLGAIP